MGCEAVERVTQEPGGPPPAPLSPWRRQDAVGGWTRSRVRALRAALPDSASDAPGFVRAAQISPSLSFCPKWVQSQGTAAGQPPPPRPQPRALLRPTGPLCRACRALSLLQLLGHLAFSTVAPSGHSGPHGLRPASVSPSTPPRRPFPCPLYRGTGGAPRAHVAH